VTHHDSDPLGAAVARYAASAREVEWRPPSELRRRAETRRRRRRIVAGSSGSLLVAVALAVSLTLSSTPAGHTAGGSHSLAASVKRAYVAYGSPSEVAVESDEQGFALALTQRLMAGQHGNLVVSPESVETALTMLELGASGATQREIATVLGSGKLSAAEQAAGWNALTAELTADASATGGGSLIDENAVFVQRNLVVRPNYLKALEQNFGVGVEPANFQAGGGTAARAINAWVANATKGRIKALFGTSSLPAFTSLVLADAVRFSAQWQVPFLQPMTKPGRFVTAANGPVTVRMMQIETDLLYISTRQLVGVVLPYAGDKYEAIAVEPRRGSLSSLVESLTQASLRSLGASAHADSVDLRIPKFSISSQASLNDALQALGLGGAFMRGADFSGITSGQLRLGTVGQSDLLSIDENGTSVAAASSTSLIPNKTHGSIQRVTFDRPFLFVIRDNATGAIITEAIVSDPSRS
jgi:serpin B